MKLTLLLSLFVTVLLPHIGICEEAERWDKAMIRKAGLWQPFVQFILNPVSRDSQKDMESIISSLIIPHDPHFDRSIDLTIFKTVATVSDQEKGEAAITLLGSIINKFGKQPSLISGHNFIFFEFTRFGSKTPDSSPFFQRCTEQRWWSEVVENRLVIIRPDGEIVGRPYDKDNDGLNFDEKECLAYYAHLRAWPNLVSEIVPLYIATIQLKSGHEDRAMVTLRDLIDKHYERLLELGKQDIVMKISIIERPVTEALMQLCGYYERAGRLDEAIRAAEMCVRAVSPDGFVRYANERLADLYAKSLGTNNPKTIEQYHLAINGLLGSVKRSAIRERVVGSGSNSGPDFSWAEKELKKIKEKARFADQTGVVNAVEIKNIIDKVFENKMEAAVDSASYRQVFYQIHEKKGAFSTPEARKSAVTKIVESINRKPTDEEPEELKLLIQTKTNAAKDLIHVAQDESEAEMRKFLLDKIGELLPSTTKNVPVKNIPEKILAIDRLVKQVTDDGINKDAKDDLLQKEMEEMDDVSLLYLSKRVEQGEMPLKAKQAIVRALASKRSIVLSPFFVGIVQRADDEALTRFATRGLEHILDKMDR